MPLTKNTKSEIIESEATANESTSEEGVHLRDGIDVDGEAEIVASDVLAGKKANEVDYGRQDVDFDALRKSRKENRQHGNASRENYTGTKDFLRSVEKEDRHSFTLNLSKKTKNIADGDSRFLEINGANRVYFFIADGYMSGEVVKSVSNKRPNLYKQAKENFYGRIKQGGEGTDIWSEFNSLDEGRDIDYSGVFGHGGDAVGNDSIPQKVSESDGRRGAESGAYHSYSNEEVEETLSALRSMYGKASRELDVINYMDAVAIAEGREMYDVKPPSDRERLANALESVAQNDIERKKLNEYKANIEKMNAESEKLKKLKAEIKELTFGKGKKDPQKLKALREEATKTENRINTYDKKLLNLEASTVLKDILLREKKKAYQKAAAKGRETLHKNVEGRNKTAMRHKIQDVAHRLDKLLNHATKERNVKKGQSALVRRALDLTDLLFASDDDLLMNGIERKRLNEYKSNIEKMNQ